MNSPTDCIVIGGGLAGLTLSIQLAKKGWKVKLFEKQQYPFHRVCGEYISLESKPFLERLGLVLPTEKFPHINTLQVSSVSGKILQRKLDLGGFGISRYLLDNMLAQLAISSGVTIMHERVEDVDYDDDLYFVKTNNAIYTARSCAGSFGKRSNLDVKWKREFVQSKASGLNNYLGIKYHVKYDHPKDLIALHNFENGYCGISAIEGDNYCLCYLTSASNLKANNGDIAQMEQQVLQRNPILQQIFTNAEFIYKEPLVISQVSFAEKEQVNHMLPLAGDAAGLITPLCGNGMSMAMKASQVLASLLDLQLQQKLTANDMQKKYISEWQSLFSKRLKTGRWVQSMFGNNMTTNALLTICKLFPFITDNLVKRTHGEPF